MRNDSCFPFESDAQYRRLRTKLVAFFDRRRCASSEDLADETLARLLKLAHAKKLTNIDAVAFGIAKNVFLEWLRQSRDSAALEEEPPDDDSTPGSQTFRLIAENAMGGLNSADRDFLEEYFIDGKGAEDLASQLGTTAGAVRGRVFRLRCRLLFVLSEMLAMSVDAGLKEQRFRRF